MTIALIIAIALAGFVVIEIRHRVLFSALIKERLAALRLSNQADHCEHCAACGKYHDQKQNQIQGHLLYSD
jgi:hypothetical protein